MEAKFYEVIFGFGGTKGRGSLRGKYYCCLEKGSGLLNPEDAEDGGGGGGGKNFFPPNIWGAWKTGFFGGCSMPSLSLIYFCGSLLGKGFSPEFFSGYSS